MNDHNSWLREQTQRNIQAKLDRLNDILQSPRGLPFPKTMEAFREWVDEDHGLRRIGSPATMNPRESPHNAALIAAVLDCIKRLKSREKSPNSKRRPLQEQLDISAAKNRELMALNAQLVSQLHMLRLEREGLVNENRQLRSKVHPAVRKVR